MAISSSFILAVPLTNVFSSKSMCKEFPWVPSDLKYKRTHSDHTKEYNSFQFLEFLESWIFGRSIWYLGSCIWYFGLFWPVFLQQRCWCQGNLCNNPLNDSFVFSHTTTTTRATTTRTTERVADVTQEVALTTEGKTTRKTSNSKTQKSNGDSKKGITNLLPSL